MSVLPTIYQCKTREELKTQITDVHKSLAEYYKSLPDDLFESIAIPEGWTIKKNMKHVVSTNGNFSVWIGLPCFFLKLLGKPKPKQLTVEQINPSNRPGITNFGKYGAPSSPKPKKKEKLLKAIICSAEKLNRAIDKRTEEELDTFCGPFGGMSLRTFIHFLIKHNIYHTNVVRSRLED